MNKIGDNELDEILSTLQEIEHIEIIRIGTRAIVVNPMRITDDLINIFKKYKPLWINTHFNHPKEITADAVKACTKIVDRPSDDVTQNMLVTIYKTDVETTELLEKFGITVSKDKIIDGTTLLLEPGQMQTLYRRAPYLISMSVTDLTQVKLEDIVDDEEIDFDSERKIPVPGNEPIVGVIDTQFNEKVYFHEWVEYKNMLSNDIQLEKKDYYHGTAVTSIIVDGPKGNPRIILEEIKTCPKKFIFASFVPINDEVVTRINPAALGNREIVYLSDDEQWDDLFSKLLDEPIIDFPDAANKKTKPRKKSIGFCGNKKKTDLFRETQILLCENKQILEQFGPDSLVAINNPMSSAINTWNQFKQNIIIPNNRKIVEAFESNISVLSMEEVEVYKKFKIHAEAFESCNKGEIIREGTPRFPVEFEQMIKGEK